MEIYKRQMETKHHSWFFVSDIHMGNANHNLNALDECIKIITETAKDRSISVILGGDLCDCINVKDPRFSPSEIASEYTLKDLKDLPRKQYQRLYDKIKPLEKYVDINIAGNHEEAYIKHNGFDVYDYFSHDLMPGVFKMGYGGLARYSLNDGNGKMKRVDFALSHGTGGGGFREGYPINNITDIFRKFDVDVCIMGHVHKMTDYKMESIRLDNGGNISYRDKYYFTSGCFLNTYSEGSHGYFEFKKGDLSHIGFIEFRCDLTTIAGDRNWHYDYKLHHIKSGV